MMPKIKLVICNSMPTMKHYAGQSKKYNNKLQQAGVNEDQD
jgi:hypothetical protein